MSNSSNTYELLSSVTKNNPTIDRSNDSNMNDVQPVYSMSMNAKRKGKECGSWCCRTSILLSLIWLTMIAMGYVFAPTSVHDTMGRVAGFPEGPWQTAAIGFAYRLLFPAPNVPQLARDHARLLHEHSVATQRAIREARASGTEAAWSLRLRRLVNEPLRQWIPSVDTRDNNNNKHDMSSPLVDDIPVPTTTIETSPYSLMRWFVVHGDSASTQENKESSSYRSGDHDDTALPLVHKKFRDFVDAHELLEFVDRQRSLVSLMYQDMWRSNFDCIWTRHYTHPLSDDLNFVVVAVRPEDTVHAFNLLPEWVPLRYGESAIDIIPMANMHIVEHAIGEDALAAYAEDDVIDRGRGRMQVPRFEVIRVVYYRVFWETAAQEFRVRKMSSIFRGKTSACLQMIHEQMYGTPLRNAYDLMRIALQNYVVSEQRSTSSTVGTATASTASQPTTTTNNGS